MKDKGYPSDNIVLGVADETIICIAEQLELEYPGKRVSIFSYDLDFPLGRCRGMKNLCTDKNDQAQKKYGLS